MSKIKWTVGGGLRFYNEFITYLDKTKDLYDLEHHIVDSVYDSPHGLIWQGGREPAYSQYALDEYIKMVKEYNKRGVKFNVTFSNTILKKEHLDDNLCNYFLKNIENKLNGAIVSSELLRRYIKKNYPQLNLKSSICLMRRDYNNLLKHYDVVILQPDDNRNLKLLKTIKNISRIEVLVNEMCVTNCKYRKKHYDNISKEYLKKILIRKKKKNLCITEEHGEKRTGELVLRKNEIEKLQQAGVVHFKLQGRDVSPRHMICELQAFIEKTYKQKFLETLKDKKKQESINKKLHIAQHRAEKEKCQMTEGIIVKKGKTYITIKTKENKKIKINLDKDCFFVKFYLSERKNFSQLGKEETSFTDIRENNSVVAFHYPQKNKNICLLLEKMIVTVDVAQSIQV